MNNEKRNQWIQRGIAGLFGVLILTVCYFVVKYFDNEPKTKQAREEVSEKNIETASSRIDYQEIWRAQLEEKDKELETQIQDLTELLKIQQKEGEGRLEEMQNLIHQIGFQAVNEAEGTYPSMEAEPLEQPKVTKLTLNLSKRSSTKPRTVDNTIPAGSFVPAVLLSGVDATASVTAGANPRPMLLRFTDLSVLPRQFRNDVMDCHCTASAWGELSSERIHARLVKLSCVERETGEILEVPIQGYVSGSDGKEGIRGVVASKEGQFLTRSLWGGVFSGIGNALSPANRASQGNPFLSIGKPEKMSTTDMFKSGFGDSANTSLNRLSEYYIERAEQIQPVIQVSAGQEVDVVFTEGVAIDMSATQHPVLKEHDEKEKGE